MKELIKNQFNWKTAALITLLYAFVSKMFLFVFPAFFIEISTVYLDYIFAIIVAFVFVNLYKDYKKNLGAIIIIALMLWYLIISLINKYAPTPKIFTIILFTFVCFCVPLMFSAQINYKILKAFIAGTLIVFTIMAVLGLTSYLINYDFIFGVPVDGMDQAKIGLHYEIGDGTRPYRLSIMSHPNTTGAYYSVMMLLAIFGVVSYKNKAVKALCVLSCVLSYFCIILSGSRTSFAATAIALCALGASFTITMFKYKYVVVKLVAGIVVGLICGVAFFFSTDAVNEGLAEFKNVVSPTQGAAISTKPVTQAVSLGYKSNTSFNTGMAPAKSPEIITTKISDYMQFSGREHIWKAGIQIIENEPAILIRGYTPVMEIITKYANSLTGLDFSFAHMHSSYIFLLIALGIPGMLILAIFVGKIIINSVKIVFCSKDKNLTGLAVFPSIILFLLVSDTMSCLLVDVNTDIFMPVFFLLCGYISYYAKTCSWSDFKQKNILK